MLKTLLANWKWDVLGVFLVVWTLGVWHVSAKFTSTEYVQKQLDEQKHTVQVLADNAKINATISSNLAKSQAALKALQATQKKVLEDALKNNPSYTQCAVDDSVHNLYKRKLQAQ